MRRMSVFSRPAILLPLAAIAVTFAAAYAYVAEKIPASSSNLGIRAISPDACAAPVDTATENPSKELYVGCSGFLD